MVREMDVDVIESNWIIEKIGQADVLCANSMTLLNDNLNLFTPALA